MNLPKLLQRDLTTEYLGSHQNHEGVRRYSVYVQGPLSRTIPEYYSDYVGGVREAKREALASWRTNGLIQ